MPCSQRHLPGLLFHWEAQSSPGGLRVPQDRRKHAQHTEPCHAQPAASWPQHFWLSCPSASQGSASCASQIAPVIHTSTSHVQDRDKGARTSVRRLWSPAVHRAPVRTVLGSPGDLVLGRRRGGGCAAHHHVVVPCEYTSSTSTQRYLGTTQPAEPPSAVSKTPGRSAPRVCPSFALLFKSCLCTLPSAT